MALLFPLLTLLLGLLSVAGLFPRALRFLGRAVGNSVRSKTQQRRELLTSRAQREEREQKLRAGKSEVKDGIDEAGTSSGTSVDEDWEKVNEEGKKMHTGQILKATNTNKNQIEVDESFEGVIGFFHPFCNAGGGGERVLFAAILATQRRYPNALCVVYTGDHNASREQILANVRNRFNIDLNAARVVFLYLTTRDFVLATKWPHFTLLGQSFGSLLLGWDAFNILVPDIFIDTHGYAFALALCKLLFPSVPTGAYVHYPTISTDMLDSLHSSSNGVNAGQGKGLRGSVKQWYWRLFAQLYSFVGGSVDVVMTNSTWTQQHISTLWGASRAQRHKQYAIEVVYPPCAVAELQEKIPVDSESEKQRTNNLVYIAQFRPEKMHHVIIDAFHAFLKAHHKATPISSRPRLVLVGSVRDDSDEKRVYKLRLQATEVKDSVDFVVNAKWPQILQYLQSSSVGVNGMWNEHFGIGVVEYQAAGLISVVNGSGGPKADIVVDMDSEPTGFHASTPEEFSDGFAKALSLSREEALAMRLRAQKSSWRFSEDVFQKAWLVHLDRLVALQRPKAKTVR